MSHLHGGGLGEYKPCKWYGALHKVMYPLPTPHPLLLHLSISLVLPLSLRRNAFCFACCLCPESHLFLLLFARLLFYSMPHRLGGKSRLPPHQLNNCHLPFASPRCSQKSFPYFVKRQIEIPTIEMVVCIPIVHNNKYTCALMWHWKPWSTSMHFKL